ncbi:hypothetical protein LJC57_05490, partial [Parabacteroides sp. OttesenSCG-928-G07]|nr:hypothetical protein [Parabacteroides sp. OttesenSCG-928-G07]
GKEPGYSIRPYTILDSFLLFALRFAKRSSIPNSYFLPLRTRSGDIFVISPAFFALAHDSFYL